MKHAREAALDTIEPVLSLLRRLKTIRERKRGVFYRQAAAFIHFHEDPAGIFVDVRRSGEWERLRVNTQSERDQFIRLVREALKE